MSSPPASPPRSSSLPPQLSDEEHEALELTRMMRSPSPPANIDGSASESNTTSQPGSSLTSSLRLESDRARRLAVTRKLHPYQRDLTDEFIRVSRHVIILIACTHSQIIALY